MRRMFAFLLMLVFVAIVFGRTDTTYVTDGECLAQSVFDNPGTDGAVVLLSETGWPVTIYVNPLIRNGVDVVVGLGVTVDRDVTGPTLNTFSVIGSNSEIRGPGKIMNSSGTGSAIFAEGANNSVVGLEIGPAVTGVYVNNGSRGALVDSCFIRNCSEVGVNLRQWTEVRVHNSQFESCDYGILALDSTITELDGVDIFACRVGAHFQEGSYVKVFRTLTYGNWRGTEAVHTDWLSYWGNRSIYDSIGVYTERVDSLYAAKSVIENPGINGVWLVNPVNTKIINNNFVSGRNAVWVDGDGSGVDVVNNIFTDVQVAIGATDSTELRSFTHNHFFNVADRGWNIRTSAIATTIGDPLWVDRVYYQLSDPESPCWGTGLEFDGVRTDRGITGGNDNWWGLPESDVEETVIKPAEFSIAAYPNPFNGVINFDVSDENQSIEIYNLQGRKIANLGTARQWSPVGIESGVYLARCGGMSQRIFYVK